MAGGKAGKDRVWVSNRSVQVDVAGHAAFFLTCSQALQIASYLVRNAQSLDAREFKANVTYKVIPAEILEEGLEGWKIAPLLRLSPEILKKLEGFVELRPTADLKPTDRAKHDLASATAQGGKNYDPPTTEPRLPPKEVKVYCLPERLQQLSVSLESRLRDGAGARNRDFNPRFPIEELLGKVRTVEDRGQAAALAIKLTRQELRFLLGYLPHLDSDELALRAAEVVAAGAPRTFLGRSIHLMKTHIRAPVGRVAARVFLEGSGQEAPRFWRVMASSTLREEFSAVTAMVAQVGRWQDLCEQNELPMEAPLGAGVALVYAVMSTGSPDLLRIQGEKAMVDALQHLDMGQWPPFLNNFFGYFHPLNFGVLTKPNFPRQFARNYA